MKFAGVLAGAALVLTPALVAAGSAGTPDSANAGQDNKKPAAGPLAGRAITESTVPAGIIVAGGLVLLGGAVIALLASGSTDSNNNTNGANVKK